MCKILVRRFPKGELIAGCYGFALKPFSKSINPYDTFTPSLSILSVEDFYRTRTLPAFVVGLQSLSIVEPSAIS